MLAIKLHNGTLLPARQVKNAETGQWGLEGSKGHHVFVIDRTGKEHYVVKHDILTLEQANELALFIEECACSDGVDLDYLIQCVKKEAYSEFLLKYVVNLDVSIVSGGKITKQNSHFVNCSETGGFFSYDAVDND